MDEVTLNGDVVARRQRHVSSKESRRQLRLNAEHQPRHARRQHRHAQRRAEVDRRAAADERIRREMGERQRIAEHQHHRAGGGDLDGGCAFRVPRCAFRVGDQHGNANEDEKSRHGDEDFSGQYLFTDVWAKKNGQWIAVASHGSRLR